eukprot:CAMPEP_0119353320 /NCGR_PEP_ID=MMETSP1334-20130426/2502_1 /TAXON_ID=127549 /ORGANISM="Calcidiscus leptoporus, Strain RCC1130" /LENGTH=389 /DNA_ID=CAMNT_0007366579 /DNA_START=89 /DNA_END=1254 /DNA_ORIENTATION=+
MPHGANPKTAQSETSTSGSKPPAKQVSFCSLYRFASRKDAALLAVGVASVLISGCNQPLQLIVFGQILDSFNSDPDEVLERIQFLAGIYALLGLQQIVTNSLQTSCFAAVAARQARCFRERYFAVLLRRPCARLDLEDSGALAASVLEATAVIQAGLGDDLAKALQQALAFVIGLVVALIFAWELALVTTAAVPCIMAVVAVAQGAYSARSKAASANSAELSSNALEAFSNIRTVVAFGHEPALLVRFDELMRGIARCGVKLGKARAMLEGTIAPIIFVMFGLGLWYGSKLVSDDMDAHAECRYVSASGELQDPDPLRCATGGAIFTAFLSVLFGFLGLLQALPGLTSIAAARASASQVFTLLDEPRSPIDTHDATGEGPRARGQVELL